MAALLACEGGAGDGGRTPDAAVAADAASADAASADAAVAADAASADAASADAAVADAAPPDAAPEAPFGGARPARVFLPAGHDPSRSWPLVVVLHGFRASGTLIDRQLGLSRRVDDDGFLLVVPEGEKNADGFQRWNAHGDGPDDVAYLTALVDEAVARYGADRGRVYVVGHSNGGHMAYKLACLVPGLVTAIAPVAGALYEDGPCDDGPPVAVLHIHGDADTQVIYAGTDRYPPAEEVTADWAARNACGEPVESGPFDLDVGRPGAETRVRTWSGCAAGADVELWRGQGVGHLNTPTAEGTRRMVEFLLRHRRE